MPAAWRRAIMVPCDRLPDAGSDVVPRTRLLERLSEGLFDGDRFARRLSLVSAPAVFLLDLRAALRCLEDEPPIRLAWLSIDEGDRDPEVRVKGSAALIYEAEFDALSPQRFKELVLAAPYTATIAGKKAILTDRLYFDVFGVLESGRLAADTEFSVGGRTFTFRGGYDPAWPEAGLVGFFPGGELRSGTLAKDARIQTASATLSLSAGDELIFEEDGKPRELKPIGLLSIAAGSGKVALKPIAVNFRPDGSLFIITLEGDIDSAKGPVALSGLVAVCDDSRSRVQAEPDPEAPTLGYLDPGDRLLVLDKSSSQTPIEDAKEFWYRVRRSSDGLVGWSYGLHLKLE